jgi:hypothetical protein
MAQKAKLLTRLAGLGSVGLGGLVLARPAQLGSLLGIDTKKQAGLALTFGLAVRDIAIGTFILRARDNQSLRQGLLFRMLAETSDFLMTGLGRGIIRQPTGRKIALSILPLLLVEWLIRQNLKD